MSWHARPLQCTRVGCSHTPLCQFATAPVGGAVIALLSCRRAGMNEADAARVLKAAGSEQAKKQVKVACIGGGVWPSAAGRHTPLCCMRPHSMHGVAPACAFSHTTQRTWMLPLWVCIGRDTQVNTQAALAAGAFGVPSIRVPTDALVRLPSRDGQPSRLFFGSDRFEQIAFLCNLPWMGPQPSRAKL
jgi:hypothetical protein